MFELKTIDGAGEARRLVAPQKLSVADFTALAKQLGTAPQKARKIGFVAAQKVTGTRVVETRWNGKETKNTAQPGDWIVANLGPDQTVMLDEAGHANIYVIRADKFPALYERQQGTNEYGAIYHARSVVEALYLSGGFEIMAPWNEIQTANAGYLLRKDTEIYGNHKETFEKTYEMI